MKLLNYLRGRANALKEKGASQLAAQRAAKMAENEKYGLMLAKMPVEFTGGYAGLNKNHGFLTIYQHAVTFKPPFGPGSFAIDQADITQLLIEGNAEIRERVTATRILLIGIFALAAKKKVNSKESFITVVDTDQQEAIFYVKNRSPADVKRLLGGAQAALLHK